MNIASDLLWYPMALDILRATKEQASAIAELLRRSIAELCVADHRNQPEAISAWLANKTPENVCSWIDNPANIVLVAMEDDRIRSAGCLTQDGRVVLNYVSPDFQFRGASKAMMAALEDEARAFGLTQIRLDSTATARNFYRAIGYIDDGAIAMDHPVPGYPMWKKL